MIAELREEFAIAEQPEWFKVIAEKRATFCCSPDLNRPSQQTPLPRPLLAGDYTAGEYPATLEGAVLSGVKCADLVAMRRKIMLVGLCPTWWAKPTLRLLSMSCARLHTLQSIR